MRIKSVISIVLSFMMLIPLLCFSTTAAGPTHEVAYNNIFASNSGLASMYGDTDPDYRICTGATTGLGLTNVGVNIRLKYRRTDGTIITYTTPGPDISYYTTDTDSYVSEEVSVYNPYTELSLRNSHKVKNGSTWTTKSYVCDALDEFWAGTSDYMDY